MAVGLGMDAFVVSISSGLAVRKVTSRHVLRVSLSFGLFQFVMPIVGWLAGQAAMDYIKAYDHWVAFGLLVGIGVKMLVGSLSGEDSDSRTDPTKGWMLLTLSIATSIAAFAVGLGLTFLNLSIWFPSVVIGVVAAGLSAAGMMLGKRIGLRFGRWAEALGGCVLIAIGIKVLIEHICA